MKKVLFVALLLGLSLTIVNAKDIEATEVPTFDGARMAGPNLGSRDPGDALFSVDAETITTDNRCLGVEHADLGNSWYVTGATALYPAGAWIYEISQDGTTLINSAAQGNSGWGWRDLCYIEKENMLYASDSSVIEQIDPATLLATTVTIASPVTPARALAYIPGEDVFWTASFSSSLYRIEKATGLSTSYANPGYQMYGAAYYPTDNVVIWWSQTGGTGAEAAYMLPDGTFTGDSWEGASLLAQNVAGGACVYDDTIYGTIFAGMHQATPDNITGYDLTPDPQPYVDLKINGQDAGVLIGEGNNVTVDIDIEARAGAGRDVEIYIMARTGGGPRSFDGTNWKAGQPVPYYAGAFMDMTATVYDAPAPVFANYEVGLILDEKIDGVLTPSYGRIDIVDFGVIAYGPWTEDFEDGLAQGWVPDDPSKWTVMSGVYDLNNISFINWISYYSVFQYADFTYTADMQQVQTTYCTQAYDYSILFRSADGTKSDCYFLVCETDGSYYFRNYVGGSYTTVTSGTMVNWVAAYDTWNTVSVDARGSTLDFTINGVLEFSASDTTHTTGYVGLHGQGSGGYLQNYQFDNVDLKL